MNKYLENTSPTTTKRFVALITQTGTNIPVIEPLINTTGELNPIVASYLGIGRVVFEIAIPLFNKIHTFDVGTPTPHSYNNFNEKIVYNLHKTQNKVEIRSFFHGGGTNDIFQLSDNKIKQVKIELEIFN